MTAIGRLVLGLARLLEEDEREEIGHFLAESVHGTDAGDATSEEQSGDEPDWDYLWHALLGASDHAHRILALLESERVAFDVSAIIESARDLRSQINSAYELMCEVHALDGLVLEANATIDDLQLQARLHRARAVDADLESMRRNPLPEAPTWTVDIDEHGGFVATTTSQAGEVAPWKFWGSAATAASAADTLAWFFHDRLPKVVFDPPASPMPLASSVADADRSPRGPVG
ncbi:hypothetical protein AB0M83_06755 [Amycolatopsis sp. NPDC051106]|uniref:hypothetical protein n=1 Tax=unclassified Amycolatopsis TaxID=2618356 RepID=UPI00341F597F